MGHHLNRLVEPICIAVSKPLLTEFDIHYRLESFGVIDRTDITFFAFLDDSKHPRKKNQRSVHLKISKSNQ